MKCDEAAEIVSLVRESIVASPNQFTIQVNVSGQNVVSHGGIGLQVTAFGGGAGSSTVGQQVSLSTAGIQIGQQRGRDAMAQEVQRLVDALEQIATQLKSAQPDKNALALLYTQLKDSWVPGVIMSVVGAAISNSVGF